jgi:hypothetical protein
MMAWRAHEGTPWKCYRICWPAQIRNQLRAFVELASSFRRGAERAHIRNR